MTYTIMQKTIGDFYICVESYISYGYPIYKTMLTEKGCSRDLEMYRTIASSTSAKEVNAKATFYRYCKKAKQETN